MGNGQLGGALSKKKKKEKRAVKTKRLAITQKVIRYLLKEVFVRFLLRIPG